MKQAFYVFLNLSKFSEYIEYYWIGYFVTFWIFPEFILGLDPDADGALGMQLGAEFIFGHATVAFSVLAVPRSMVFKTLLTVIFVLVYGLFLYALSQRGATLPVIFFVIYLIGKIRRAFVHSSTNRVDMHQEANISFARLMLFLVSAFMTLFPWPQLGLSRVTLDIPGRGIMVDEPQKFLVFFICYFSLIAWLEIKIRRSRDFSFKNLLIRR